MYSLRDEVSEIEGSKSMEFSIRTSEYWIQYPNLLKNISVKNMFISNYLKKY